MGYMPGPGPGLCEEVLPEGGPVLGDTLQYVRVEGAGIHIWDTCLDQALASVRRSSLKAAQFLVTPASTCE
jgi:hypothetical protein